jgi:hypothetical protein
MRTAAPYPAKGKMPLSGLSTAPGLRQVLKDCWMNGQLSADRPAVEPEKEKIQKERKQLYSKNRKKVKRYFVHLKKSTFE